MRFATFAPVVTVLLATFASATEPGKTTLDDSTNVKWHDNYKNAMKLAKKRKGQLIVFFSGNVAEDPTEKHINELAGKAQFKASDVFVQVPMTYKIKTKGEEIVLLKHGAFAELMGYSGLAIIDLRDKASNQYGYVVSILPYIERFPTQHELKVLFSLPKGTLTQRTLIYAVRTHPESPQSAIGNASAELLEESQSHSEHQANITLQGHHNWNTRFHRINSRLPGMLAQEVVAESWPGQGLFAAAKECVHSWRQSSGHWNAVRSRQNKFGYDMKRGRNGTWYATGIFARRR